MLNFMEVPNDILTGKDLDYLSDMFEWNYIAFKKTNTAIGIVNDQEIVSLLEKGVKLFETNLISVLNILESRGNNE
jgi:hypothetical protein